MTTAHNNPSTHARNVPAGMVGSSVFATAERTSGYGDSSSAKVQWKKRVWTLVARTEVLSVKVDIRIVIEIVLYNALVYK